MSSSTLQRYQAFTRTAATSNRHLSDVADRKPACKHVPAKSCVTDATYHLCSGCHCYCHSALSAAIGLSVTLQHHELPLSQHSPSADWAVCVAQKSYETFSIRT